MLVTFIAVNPLVIWKNEAFCSFYFLGLMTALRLDSEPFGELLKRSYNYCMSLAASLSP